MSYSKATWLTLALGALVVVGAGCAGSASKETLDTSTDATVGAEVTDDTGAMMDDSAEMTENEEMMEGEDAMMEEGGDDTAMTDDGTPVDAEVVREIHMVAHNWEFVPSELHVSLGETVRLVITNEDVDHGLMIPTLGVNQKIPAGETMTVEFTADTAGEHSFFCNVFCGSGHRDMRGTLIVE